jgi:hypothetical protein
MGACRTPCVTRRTGLARVQSLAWRGAKRRATISLGDARRSRSVDEPKLRSARRCAHLRGLWGADTDLAQLQAHLSELPLDCEELRRPMSSRPIPDNMTRPRIIDRWTTGN